MPVLSYPQLAEEVKQYAIQFFRNHPDERYIYHNLEHTQQVVNAVVQMASHYQLSDHDFFIVLTAAWFHDTGYFTDGANHEKAGADTAAAFLKDKHTDKETIDAIQKCILATRLPQHANSLQEQIVCDADLFHLGTDDFDERNKLMRREVMAFGKDISKQEWRKTTIALLESHHYYTDYCQLLLNTKKQQTLESLKSKAEKIEAANINNTAHKVISKQDGQPKEEEKKKDSRPERGIETMFRISSANHQRLSDQADSKSQILITVNSIIISVLLSVLLRTLEEYPYLKIPAYLLLSVNVVTIICAILATRPSIPPGTFTQNDIAEKKVNLLFFGNFYKMSLQEYASGMLQMMEDREFLYGSLIRDVYAQGVVLGRKYRMLRAAYNIFMFGLILSVLAFVTATLTR